MSFFRSNSVTAGQSVVISRCPVATVTKQVRGSSVSRLTVRSTSRDHSRCAACGGKYAPGFARWLHSVEVAGRIYEGGTACGEDCYWTLRVRMANELFYSKAIKYDSINYEGKPKRPLRLNRDISTGDFPTPNLARRELLLQAAERGCSYIIQVEVHDEVVLYSDGSEETVYWGTGRV